MVALVEDMAVVAVMVVVVDHMVVAAADHTVEEEVEEEAELSVDPSVEVSTVDVVVAEEQAVSFRPPSRPDTPSSTSTFPTRSTTWSPR